MKWSLPNLSQARSVFVHCCEQAKSNPAVSLLFSLSHLQNLTDLAFVAASATLWVHSSDALDRFKKELPRRFQSCKKRFLEAYEFSVIEKLIPLVFRK